ncbi:MAG: hypothetical protein E6772_01975 [Dysgonomonas sp.]|nr:hypothetical protein [Dysgonomonas sp.]
MKKIVSLFAVLLILASCAEKFDRSKIDKLDNMYANNNIMSTTVIKYNYKNGVLDSINGKVLNITEYGLRGNLTYYEDREKNEFQKNSFKGTIMTESDIYSISDSTLKHKIKYSYKDNIVTDSYFDKEGKPLKKYVHYLNQAENDTLYEEYSKDDKLAMKSINKYDSIGPKFMRVIDIETPQANYTLERINNSTSKYHYTYLQKDINDSIQMKDSAVYNTFGKMAEHIRTMYRKDQNIHTHIKYNYLTEDGLIDNMVFYNEEGQPLFVHQYKYEKY